MAGSPLCPLFTLVTLVPLFSAPPSLRCSMSVFTDVTASACAVISLGCVCVQCCRCVGRVEGSGFAASVDCSPVSASVECSGVVAEVYCFRVVLAAAVECGGIVASVAESLHCHCAAPALPVYCAPASVLVVIAPASLPLCTSTAVIAPVDGRAFAAPVYCGMVAVSVLPQIA